MDKQILIDLIKNGLASGSITKNDLQNLLAGDVQTPSVVASAPAIASQSPGMPVMQASAQEHTEKHHVNISKVLYYVGGLIVLIGVGVFVAQFWEDVGSTTRILISLGGALIAYSVGVALSKLDEKSEVASVFHLLGGCLYPFGIITFLTESGAEIGGWSTFALIFGGLALLYAGTMLVVANSLVTLFVIAYATAALFSISQHLLENAEILNFYQYFAITVGAGYLYMGTQFIGTRNEQISRMLLFLGSVWVLGGAFGLEDLQPFWEIIYPFLIAGVITISIHVKRMSVLFVSTVAIMAYVAYITGEYFANSIGWPLALVIIGLLFIATGYFSFSLHQKYFK